MGSRMSWLHLLVIGVAAFGSRANAQEIECSNELAPVVPCLEYVQGNGKAPSSDCCTGLTSLLKSSPVCLCKLAEGKLNLSATGINVDLKRALQLPSACKLQGADKSRCAVILAPAGSPHVEAPGPSPPLVAGGETAGPSGSTNPSSAPFSMTHSHLIAVTLAAAAGFLLS